MIGRRNASTVLRAAILGTIFTASCFTGCKSATHSVTLTWNAPAPVGNTPIQGYNVYRSATSGGTYELVVSRIPAPTYTDSTVSSGKTYYYVVTTIDQSGAESKYSDEIKATVP